MAESDLLSRYYIAQAGSGGGDFYSGPIYQRGSGRNQRGAGIGSFLGGLFRKILPVLRKGTAAIGREVINSGSNFIGDIGNNVNPRVALKARSREAVTNLARQVLHGEGYKPGAAARKRQSSTSTPAKQIKRRKTTKNKKKSAKNKKSVKRLRKNKDIFSK